MKINTKIWAMAGIAMALIFPREALAYRYVGAENGETGVQEQTAPRAARCAPAKGIMDMEWNNVRALIETGGSMWQDRSINKAAYEVPVGGGVSAIYAGALWMGGLEKGTHQLKIAAVDYRQGNDFWPGPLARNTAEIDETTCEKYDRFFVSYRQDIERHRAYWECKSDPFCDEVMEFPNYATPGYFYDWPAHGNVSQGQEFYLAPFYDFDGGGFDSDGVYDPNSGDYPAFDILGEIDCDRRSRETKVPLYGDFNMYWIFNDKGNIHTETQGEPIGMEIRAQAFAFSSNDEINNMTFYNYLMINQGTKTLEDTYFGQWTDADLGDADDDYVGCDVSRGLAYCYNETNFDKPSVNSPGYGAQPPAIGIDFFEGPFQDADGIDNPLTLNYSDALAQKGIPYDGIGIGYGDDIIDNERFGMRKFVFYNNSTAMNGDPQNAAEYYGYLTGYWRNNGCLTYGEDGFDTDGGGICADYMFPGDTDPIGWGVDGQQLDPWNEYDEDNPAGDRRLLQSAGPFTLEPGARNNITVGVVYARAEGGGPLASVELMRLADDKAQALFNHCFEIIDGPDAPDVEVQELNRQIILNLSNDNPISNNFHEHYTELDPLIPEHNSNGEPLSEMDRSYVFQGYQVYQLRDEDVSVSDLSNVELARLIYTTDVQDSITQIVNYIHDPAIGLPIPTLMAEGPNEGLLNSFSITNDAFATGDTRLINHRTYHFIVLAYAWNEYEPYDPNSGFGQYKSYKASRKAPGMSIRTYTAIPHNTAPEAGGTAMHVEYGDHIPLTRIEGKGNSGRELMISQASHDLIMSGSPWRADMLEYTAEGSPVEVKVIDPLQLQDHDYFLRINPDNGDLPSGTVSWTLSDAETGTVIYEASHLLNSPYEEIIAGHGISVRTVQSYYSDSHGNYTDLISASIDFNGGFPWLYGVEDDDSFTQLNWIRSGSQGAGLEADDFEKAYDDVWPPDPTVDNPIPFNDPDENYEQLLGGTWSPYCLTSWSDWVDGVYVNTVAPRAKNVVNTGFGEHIPRIRDLNNVDVVITPNRELWTRCPVLEMQPNELRSEGEATKMQLRDHDSVDRDGLTVAQGGSASEATLNGAQPKGMGWFPGYAIDVSTGERLNMAFGEDSDMPADNGDDMLWNPSSRVENELFQVFAGGQHWVYIFKNTRYEEQEDWIPGYDQGVALYESLTSGSTFDKLEAWKSCTWVGSAILNEDYAWKNPADGLVPGEATIHLRVSQPYSVYRPGNSDISDTTQALNHWNPMYHFSTKQWQAETNSSDILEDALAMINIVPNPYYAFSEYEANKLDNRVKITNLPEVCTVSIYSVSGTLIRSFSKSDPLTSLDWDLKNEKQVPIAGGVYIIHVDVPGIGERILKWFGVVRPIDLDNF